MSRIPPDIRAEMAKDPFYKKCCLAHLAGCGGRIEWHHVLIYGGKQIQEPWAIVPACHNHHMLAAPLHGEFLSVCLNRASESELRVYSKSTDYVALRDRLNNTL